VRRPRILHVSGDYPDAFDPAKTSVIRTLCDLVDDRFEQGVISLNRSSPGAAGVMRLAASRGHSLETQWKGEHERVLAARYAAPGRGLFHRAALEALADQIVDRLEGQPRPDLLVGHKLTIEGLIVARLAERWRVPYALCVQGNTDTRILAARPDLVGRLRRIWHGAAVAFPFAPWAARDIALRLGARRGPTIPLPCPTLADAVRSPVVAGRADIVSVFHLRHRALKNLPRLARAADVARTRVPDLRVGVVGGGEPSDRVRVEALASAHPGLRLEGALPHQDIAGRLNRAAGFALPSLRESFGLVFVEALMAGCPIVYPAGRAVDGWFDDLPFAIRVAPRDTGAIADALVRLVRDEAALKRELALWQSGPGAQRFRRPAIARAFGDGLARAAGRVANDP
jgi:glycosyltransferase involved in cell wall biosynthesis